MTTHVAFVAMGYGWARRLRRLGVRHRRDRRSPGPGAPARGRYRRQLAQIERSLMTETPALSAKFAMFNDLTGGEQPTGVERLPAPPVLRRPRTAHLAVLLALAAIMTLCLTLSAHVRTVVRPCHASAGTGTSAPSPLRGTSCAAYANTK